MQNLFYNVAGRAINLQRHLTNGLLNTTLILKNLIFFNLDFTNFGPIKKFKVLSGNFAVLISKFASKKGEDIMTRQKCLSI